MQLSGAQALEGALVTTMNEVPDLKGRKRPAKATRWLYAPLVLLGGVRVVAYVAQQFDTSLHDGVVALVTIAAIVVGAAGFFLALGVALEALMVARARIKYSDIRALRRETLELYGGKEPGLVIDTVNGPFELGFVRTAVFRPFSISERQAKVRFRLFEAALASSR